MERRDQDCYFYYYSTCAKGEQCVFRHEPAALGCEKTCPHWQKRNCVNVHCNLRHMEMKKNRKTIPCYWENQPSGCIKPHCPFLHKYPRDRNQIAELEKKECEPQPPPAPQQPQQQQQQQQVSTSRGPLDRGDWSHPGYERTQEHVQVASEGDVAVTGTPRVSQGNVTPGPVPDPLVVSLDDGIMRLY
ncbi:UNVERIFIED_CONTAM: hypothetical protein PYX00_005684 [Menopon gallinae]|uniref:C3H1-type domain-containing protein n=1 Tax=Menopon gallinae TaxID=328185 RepID=A0AAW2HTP0_9NEOP